MPCDQDFSGRSLLKKYKIMISKVFLCLHIISGFLALCSGLTAIVSKKGGKVHRFSGKIFFFAMLGVCFTSVYISITKNNQFLLVIGIFSFYLNYFGFMAVKDKSLKPKPLDWFVLLVTAVAAFFMMYSLKPVLMVFGVICFYLIVQNVRVSILILQKKELPKLKWMNRHISMMVGAFIATTTAFLVVNLDSLSFIIFPAWLGWLLPTFLLVPLIFYYQRKYAPKK